MTTLQIPDELAERMAAEARRRNVTLDQLIALGIEKLSQEPDEEVARIIEDIIKDNVELYRRLA
jgi:vacuolar-type H+-ATPase subunit B/Vma2